MWPAGALNDVTFPKTLEYLLSVLKIKPLRLCNLGRSDRCAAVPLREVEGAQNAAFAPFCYAHSKPP
jgi:hypothetical protein